jgi:hypothetical protein
VCIDAIIKDSTIQSDVKRFCTAFKTEVFGSLPAVRTPICLLFHLSGRRAIPFGCQSDQASSVRSTCIFRPNLYCIEKLLFQPVSVRTSQQPVQTPLSDRSASDSFQVQNQGRLIHPSGQCGFPSERAHI